MNNKFVNGTMLNNFAKKLKSNIKSDLLGDKKLRYLTQAEYDLLTDDEKNDENIVYNITDADIEGFSGDYNDLTNKPNYAGSSSEGGAATTALTCTGNAATATTASNVNGLSLWTGTKADYDAITSKSDTTLYFIKEG